MRRSPQPPTWEPPARPRAASTPQAVSGFKPRASPPPAAAYGPDLGRISIQYRAPSREPQLSPRAGTPEEASERQGPRGGTPLPGATRAPTEGGFGFHFSKVPLHAGPPRPHAPAPGFRLSQPGDALERQADAVADSLTSGGARATVSRAGPGSGVGVNDGPVLAGLHGLEGGGHALPSPQRAALEEGLGMNLGGVRVHTSMADGALARELGARAFTVGEHVVFAPGQYAPGTGAGDRLLAHEVTHVAQQAGSRGTGQPPLVQRDTGVGAWWERNVTKTYQGLKEKAYTGMIDGVRAFQRKAFDGLRAAAAALPPSLQGPAGVLVSIAEEAFGACMAVVYAVIGILVGFSEGIVDVVKGFVQLLYTVVELLVTFVLGFFSGKARAAFDQHASEIVAAVKGLPAAIKKLVTDWVTRFEKAPTERQSLMIGELTGQIIALIATFEVAAAKAGQLPKLTVPVLVPQKGGQLAVAVAGVSVGEPAAAAVLTGTGVMMTTGSSGGSAADERKKRLDELADDKESGKNNADTRREAEVALSLEEQGKLKPKVRRPQKGDGHSGDFVDGAGKDWDVKRPYSRGELIQEIQKKAAAKGKPPRTFSPTEPVPGEFSVRTVLAEIQGEIQLGENVIVDTSKLNAADLTALRQAVTQAGLDAHVLFFP